MKPTFVVVAIWPVLLWSAGMANAQQTQRYAHASARARMVEDANMSAQSITDVSYGGVPDTHSATGGVREAGTLPISAGCARGTQRKLSSRH